MSNTSKYAPDNPLIPETDTVFDMTTPDFQAPENEWITEMDQSAIPADGTVLYLNQLLLDDQSSVLIKSSPENTVHLIIDNPLVTSENINIGNDALDGSTSTHHYYEFPNDLKVYSEYGLQLIFLDS